MTGLALALAVAGGAALAAGATPAGHDHGGAAARPAAPTAEHGRQWATDAPLREGMGRIRAMVAPQLAAAHAGSLKPAQYAALARQIEREVAGIVARCRLEPEADAALHGVIADIGAGVGAMSTANGEITPAQGLLKVAGALNDYAARFEHPGFRPIRGVH